MTVQEQAEQDEKLEKRKHDVERVVHHHRVYIPEFLRQKWLGFWPGKYGAIYKALVRGIDDSSASIFV